MEFCYVYLSKVITGARCASDGDVMRTFSVPAHFGQQRNWSEQVILDTPLKHVERGGMVRIAKMPRLIAPGIESIAFDVNIVDLSARNPVIAPGDAKRNTQRVNSGRALRLHRRAILLWANDQPERFLTPIELAYCAINAEIFEYKSWFATPSFDFGGSQSKTANGTSTMRENSRKYFNVGSRFPRSTIDTKFAVTPSFLATSCCLSPAATRNNLIRKAKSTFFPFATGVCPVILR
jgi:hypothetical protein